jgi:hypothetical protein
MNFDVGRAIFGPLLACSLVAACSQRQWLGDSTALGESSTDASTEQDPRRPASSTDASTEPDARRPAPSTDAYAFTDAAPDSALDGALATGDATAEEGVAVREPPATELWAIRLLNTRDYAFTAVEIDRIKIPEGGLLGPPIRLPLHPSGRNYPFTLDGYIDNGKREGKLLRSLDGRFVTLAGYGVGPGSRLTSGDVPRVVARIDASGAIDVTTRVIAFDRHSIEGALTIDGSRYWSFGTLGVVQHAHGVDSIGTLVHEGTAFFGHSADEFLVTPFGEAQVRSLGRTPPLVSTSPIDTYPLGELRGESYQSAFFHTRAGGSRDLFAARGAGREPAHTLEHWISTDRGWQKIHAVPLGGTAVVSQVEGPNLVHYSVGYRSVRRTVDDVSLENRRTFSRVIHEIPDGALFPEFLGVAFGPRR